MEWPDQVMCTEENRTAYRIWVQKPEGKRLHVKLRMHGKMLQLLLNKKNGIHLAQNMDQLSFCA
jgi:hypothetical protein